MCCVSEMWTSEDEAGGTLNREAVLEGRGTLSESRSRSLRLDILKISVLFLYYFNYMYFDGLKDLMYLANTGLSQCM